MLPSVSVITPDLSPVTGGKMVVVPPFQKIMPRNQWSQINFYLYVYVDGFMIPRGQPGHRPLFKVCNVLDDLLHNLRQMKKDTCIDESMI